MTPETIRDEFEEAGIGDTRLDRRLVTSAVRIAGAPDKSFPKIFPEEADLEGFYRFIRNDRVSMDVVLEPHVQATIDRIGEHQTALVIHDTTEFRFRGERDGMGRLLKSGRGFYGHFSLACALGERPEPLGVVAVHTWARKGKTATQKRLSGDLSYKESRALNTEQKRWGRQIEEVERRVADAASIVHIMDSEADDYALFCRLVSAEQRFVVRLCYDRRLDMDASKSAPRRKTIEFVSAGQVVCTRKVKISGRTRRPGGGKKKVRMRERKPRVATLKISATPVVFRRPTCVKADFPKTVSVNVVRVWEPKPPKDAEPVEWHLITTEPIATESDILKVIDCYRFRWLIEEYFKALKTGCDYEKRQLDSLQTLLVALAIFVPVAWSLLRLRHIARDCPESPAESVLTPTQLKVLRLSQKKIRLPKRPNARTALMAVARLGGHLRRNGEPGWQVLGRGYNQLLDLTAGYMLARSEM